MKVVKVYGALRKRLGQCRFEFDVATPAQAIKALCVNFPGLDKWLIDSEKDGVGYRVAVSKEKVTEENVAPLLMPFSDREVFSITPVVAGAGGVYWFNFGWRCFDCYCHCVCTAAGGFRNYRWFRCDYKRYRVHVWSGCLVCDRQYWSFFGAWRCCSSNFTTARTLGSRRRPRSCKAGIVFHLKRRQYKPTRLTCADSVWTSLRWISSAI